VVKRAMDWCARSVDAQGRPGGPQGPNALEGGGLAREAHVQGAWIAALGAASRLAQAEQNDPAQYRELEEKARAGFEAVWSEERGHYAYGAREDGQRCDGLSAYLAYPLARGLGARERSWASVQALVRPALTTDWGARRFAVDAVPEGTPGA